MNNLSGKYLAFEISDKSRANLLNLFRPNFSKVICHHVTIEFNLTQEKYDSLEHLIKHPPNVIAYGYAKGDGIECIAVAIGNVTDRPDGSFFHITLSLSPPHKPVESKKLEDKVVGIKGMFRSIDSIKIDGTFKLLNK